MTKEECVRDTDALILLCVEIAWAAQFDAERGRTKAERESALQYLESLKKAYV